VPYKIAIPYKDIFIRYFPPSCYHTNLFEKQTTSIGSRLLSKMGYAERGLGNNGHGIVVPITLEMKSPRTSLGYNFFVSSLPTPGLTATREVLFFVGGVHIGFS